LRTAASNSHGKPYTYGYSDPDWFTEHKTHTRSAVPSYSGATSVTSVDEKEIHCSRPTSSREDAKNFSVRIFEPVCSNWSGSILCWTGFGSHYGGKTGNVDACEHS